MTSPELFILDATAFIGLEFPLLMDSKAFPNAVFFTTFSVASELKDFRSRMNLESLKQSGLLQLNIPQTEILLDITKKIQEIDPHSPLSSVDMDILALALELGGTLISNDFTIQNAAYYLKIPIKTLNGKKIENLRIWQLKCKGCGKKIETYVQACPHCGGQMIKRQFVNIEQNLKKENNIKNS
ncbi:MAG: NOB1 family endonuclease [Candidatus Hodarchaeota archaeon]